ncbi:MAG TPA: sugar phosphate isomerase/epimerase family protein [Candidatus Brocadiia bacterium]|nr:sugar phosphate isomerase/epimerase family protein [Candidatus Brocadiia bacterium]
MQAMPIGVFVSAGPELKDKLQFVKKAGATTVQMHCPPKDARSPEAIEKIKKLLADADIEVTLVFIGFPGESYATIPIVAQTVGLVPKATRAERLTEAKQIGDFAAALGAPGVGVHMGFIPEDANDPEYKEVVKTAQELADYVGKKGLRMHLETGQESAKVLLRFFKDVGRENLAINFDPANLILYGTGQPLEDLKLVGRYVKSCHCKDAAKSAVKGEWGRETPLGEGEVIIPEFIKILKSLGYSGPLTIEREISGDQQLADIKKAVELLKKCKKDLGIGGCGCCCS